MSFVIWIFKHKEIDPLNGFEHEIRTIGNHLHENKDLIKLISAEAGES